MATPRAPNGSLEAVDATAMVNPRSVTLEPPWSNTPSTRFDRPDSTRATEVRPPLRARVFTRSPSGRSGRPPPRDRSRRRSSAPRQSRGHLVVHPGVGGRKAVLEADRGRPAQTLANQRVVAVASPHPLRSVELVPALQLHAGDALDDLDELVDGDELIAADVERLADVAGREPERPLEAVVDVGEATRLLPVTPDLDAVVAGQHRGGHLAADRRRRLLAPAVPRALRAVDVVVAGHAGLDAEVLGEVPRH